jgi:hypothetical protein
VWTTLNSIFSAKSIVSFRLAFTAGFVYPPWPAQLEVVIAMERITVTVNGS